MIITSYEQLGYNGKFGQIFDVNFNDANYSTIINFDTKATNINLTTLIKFDEYTYTTVPFTQEERETCTKCFTLGEITLCCPIIDCNQKVEIASKKQTIIVDTKEKYNTDIITY